MLKKRKLKFFVKLLVFSFLSLHLTLAAQQCCPDSHLVEKKFACADNKTLPNVNCPNGAFLLDPNEEGDQFWLDGNKTLIVSNEHKVGAEEFCLSSLLKNGSIASSYEVALVCFPTTREPNTVFTKTLIIFSILFLSITLYIYVVLPNLRDFRGKCVMAFICSLLGGYITLSAINIFPQSSQPNCFIQGAILYFFMSSSFFWNNVITFNIWKAVRNISFKLSNRTWAFIYIVWGFGVPFLMVAILFILENVPTGNHIRPHFAETKCWFKGKQETWTYFYGPISVLLMINILMFLHCSWTLWKNYKDNRFSRIRSLRYKCIMYLKLFLLMGLTWVFEIISYATNENSYIQYLWFLTDCINGAQGIFIFLILVVFRQKVKLGLLKKKMFGINWPKSWEDKEIQESSQLSYTTDIELGNQKLKILNESQNDREVD